MNDTTHRESRPGTLALRVTAPCHSRPRTALVAVVLVIGLIRGGAPAAAQDGSATESRVGHKVERIVVPGAAQNEPRQVDVHLWYPADPLDAAGRPKAVYTSALYGKPLPHGWLPLSWKVEAEIAREGAALDPHGGALPVIVFTHGNINVPIDYAHTLERIAAAGFVVAAPYHTSNTQDDVRVDFINEQARLRDPDLTLTPQERVFNCNDGLPARTLSLPAGSGGDCSKSNVPFSMADRVRDISRIIGELPGWFGDRVNAEGVGVLGHSRGTATALAAAGGSAAWSPPPPPTVPPTPPTVICTPPTPVPAELCWPLQREPRVDAIMGMAIASRPITTGANLTAVDVPALLVAGTLDTTSPPEVSKDAFDAIKSADKQLVYLENAVHRSFDSTYCDQLQAVGAVLDTDGDGVVEATVAEPEASNPRPILDRHTFAGIHAFPLSGLPVQYCSFAGFTSPTDVRALVTSPPGFDITADSVPSTGLGSDVVKQCMTELAVEFFSAKLDRDGDGVPDAADNGRDTANADQVDADGDGTRDACDPTPRGTTPPAIVVPGHLTADATGPGGATVAYTVTATDDIDPDPTVLCTPSAGSLFVIGDTRVECVATDAGGNTAYAGFLVTVLGAKEQLAQLIAKVIDATSLPAAVKTQLIQRLQSLSADFDPTNPKQRTAACLALKAFTTLVRFVAPPAQAAEWTADANRIRAVLAC